MRFTVQNRLSAFLAHLTISGAVAALAIIVVFFIWYPAPLHLAVGVTEIFLMLLIIDIIIGPIITFIIFKPNKPSLKFDLSVIALLQLCALTYGMYTVFIGRPAFVVYNVDRFDIARAIDLDQASAEQAKKSSNQTAQESWFKPLWVGAVASSDPKRRQDIMFSSAMGGADWPLLPELYVPLLQVKTQMLAKAKPMAELRKLSEKNVDAMRLLSKQQEDNDVKWLPLRGKAKNMVVIINANTAEIQEVLDINPWL